MFDWLKNLWSPKPADPYVEFQAQLVDMVRRHGLDVSTHDHWTLPYHDLPALRACGQRANEKPDFVTRQIDIELRLDAHHSIVEQYGGYGVTLPDANSNALYTFCIGTFHVYLSAFWNHHEPDQVEIESWQINGADWQTYCGNAVIKTSSDVSAELPAGYQDAVKAYMTGLSLDGDLHWVSIFVSRLRDDLTVQTQLDNADCRDLDARMAALDWPFRDGFYSVRNFFLLRKR